MAKMEEKFDPLKYMKMAVEVMKKSIQEPRKDKVSPKVGAVLIKPDGKVETAYRGELRHGDHAEFSLLERKNRAVPLDGSLLFATLEPCAPGARKHPKLGCAERIVNARIKKVWIGIEDPDPLVDRKGITYLEEHGIEVEMFPTELQDIIRLENQQFLIEAEERAMNPEEPTKAVKLSEKEEPISNTRLDDFSRREVETFIDKAKLNQVYGSDEFIRTFQRMGLLANTDQGYLLTGFGLLLFGEQPQLNFPNSLIRATFKMQGRDEEVQTFEGSLPRQIDQVQAWYETRIGSQIDRNQTQRTVKYDYPLKVFREAIINAIAHRDYDLKGAPIHFEINDEAIIVRSPGKPVYPLTLKQVKSFSAPSLSRNPTIVYVLDKLKLVEQRGLGFKTIKELPTQNLPLPFVTFDDPYLVFTFPRSVDVLRSLEVVDFEELTEEELRGFEWIRETGEISSKEYATRFGLTQRTASRHITKMIELHLLETNGESLKSPKLRYKVRYE
jgi:ATP-dependent DNA helicase RecG